LTLPNGTSDNGTAQVSLEGSRGPQPLLYAQNSAAGDAKVLQFVETGCAGQTYGVWGVTYSPDGTGVVGIAGSDALVCSGGAGDTGTGIGVKGISAYAGGFGVFGRNDAINGIGIYGSGRYGLYGAGTDFGVFGGVSNAGGYAGYFNGQGYFRGNVGIGAPPTKRLTVAGDAELGTAFNDYHALRIGGGNSNGFLYTSYPAYGDGIHLGYNSFAKPDGTLVSDQPDGGASRISAGYGYIGLATCAPGFVPTIDRLSIDATGNINIPGHLTVGS